MIQFNSIHLFTSITIDGRDYRVVSITDNKTDYLGPVDLPMTVEEHLALTNVVSFVQGLNPDSKYPFISLFSLGKNY